jgi:hypothetical protein
MRARGGREAHPQSGRPRDVVAPDPIGWPRVPGRPDRTEGEQQGAAYWFTASTSFANPAVTVARAVSDSFAGIHPRDVPGFIIAQAIGATAAVAAVRWLVPPIDSENRTE